MLQAASADPAPLDARARGLQDSVSEYEDQLNALRSMAEDARRVAKEPKLDPIARLKNASGVSDVSLCYYNFTDSAQTTVYT